MKLKTGISTSGDFTKIMKEKGVEVSAEFPAETLRDQLDSVNKKVNITFESTIGAVLTAVNKSKGTVKPVEPPKEDEECKHEHMNEVGEPEYVLTEETHRATRHLVCDDCGYEIDKPDDTAEEHTFVFDGEHAEQCSVCGKSREKDFEHTIRLKVHPNGDNTTLIENVTATLTDSADEVFNLDLSVEEYNGTNVYVARKNFKYSQFGNYALKVNAEGYTDYVGDYLINNSDQGIRYIALNETQDLNVTE